MNTFEKTIKQVELLVASKRMAHAYAFSCNVFCGNSALELQQKFLALETLDDKSKNNCYSLYIELINLALNQLSPSKYNTFRSII